jgi:hypothetical protein
MPCRTTLCHAPSVIQRVVTRRSMKGFDEIRENLVYWRSRPVADRVAAVEILRRQVYGNTARLQRSARVLQQVRADPMKDRVDIEALGEE